MRDIVGREIGKGIEEGIEEGIRQNIWQSEVGDGMLSLVAQLAPRPCQVRGGPHPPAEIGEVEKSSPLQSKEGTKVMYRAGAHEGNLGIWMNMDAYDLLLIHMAVTFLDRPVGYGYGDTLVHRCHLGLSLTMQHSSPLHITSDITSEGKLQESPS